MLISVAFSTGCAKAHTLALPPHGAVLLGSPAMRSRARTEPPSSASSNAYVRLPPRSQRGESGATDASGVEPPIETQPLGTAGGWSVSVATIPNEKPSGQSAPIQYSPNASTAVHDKRASNWLIPIGILVAAAAGLLFWRRRSVA